MKSGEIRVVGCSANVGMRRARDFEAILPLVRHTGDGDREQNGVRVKIPPDAIIAPEKLVGYLLVPLARSD